LRDSAKEYGNRLLERLNHADAALVSLAHAGGDLDRLSQFVLQTADSPFLGFAFVSRGEADRQLLGDTLVPSGVLKALLRQLASGNADKDRSRIETVVDEAGARWIALARSVSRPGGGTLIGLLDPDHLWGKEELDPRIGLCVLGPGDVRLFCSDSPLAPSLQQAARAEAGTDDAVVRTWALFLRAPFDAASWQVVAGVSRSELLADLSAFKSIFLRVVSLTLALVGLLSVHQIRHSFLPLEALMEGIRRIGHQDFEHRMAVTAKDEFGRLAKAFGS
jgi:methyl-accepting chemotaxis protein